MRHRSSVLLLSLPLVVIVVALAWTVARTPKVLALLGTYEPPNGTAYFGFTMRLWDSADTAYGDTRPYVERFQDAVAMELGGKAPSVFGVPTIWQNADGSMVPFSNTLNTINKALGANGGGGTPLISWNAQTGWNAQSATYSGITTLTVASGSLDDYIRQYARDVKAYGDPLFIRLICGEANGTWWRPCSPGANTSLTKADFITAWQHVVDIFRTEGVTNVAWVWNMNTFPASAGTWGIDPDIAAYYPGDGYVDWVGADHYDYGSPSSSATNPLTVGTYLDPHYAFAVAHGKPFFLAEWGIKHPGALLTAQEQVQWLNAMFEYIESHPLIKAVLYFNYNSKNTAIEDAAHMADHIWLYNNTVNYHPSTNDQDHRLLTENGANYRGTFSQRIANPRYISSPASNAAQFVSQTVPLTLMVGSSATVTVTMRNGGIGTTWTRANGYQLWSQNPPDNVTWGLSRIDLDPADVIVPGQTKVFTFSIRAPLTTGSYPFQWQMWQDVAEQFGEPSSPTMIVVSPDTLPPTVSLTAPTNGANVSGMTTLTAVSSDNVGVTRVEFLVDDAVVGSSSIAPYTFAWNTASYAHRTTHVLKAKAYDTAQNVALSSPVSVMVLDVTPPSVAITSPANNSTVPRNTTITISATASDVSGVGKVEFAVDGVLKCADAAAPYTCAWNVPPNKNKNYTLTATASDSALNRAIATVKVTAK